MRNISIKHRDNLPELRKYLAKMEKKREKRVDLLLDYWKKVKGNL